MKVKHHIQKGEGKMKFGIIIPSDCPDQKLVELTKELIKINEADVIVVDDGCGNDMIYTRIFQKIEENGCTVLHHEQRVGKGNAIKTGIRYVMNHCPQALGIVTAGEDDSRQAQGILQICERMKKEKSSIIVGTREWQAGQLTLKRRLEKAWSALRFKLATGIRCTDAKTELRGIPKKYFDVALSTECEGPGYGVDFLTKAAKIQIPLIFLSIKIN